MNKIVALSNFGFKIDSLNSKWLSMDKYSIDKTPFKQLKKGVLIDSIILNDKGFVTSFSVVGVDGGVVPMTPDFSPSSSSNHSKDILKGQCLNIVFNKLNLAQLSDPKFRNDMYDLALILFKELELRKW